MQPYDVAILLGYPEISGGTNVILEHALGMTRLGHRVSIVTELPFDARRLGWKPGAAELPLLAHEELRRSGRVFDLAIATWWRSVFDLPHVPARRYAYFCQSIESRFFSAAEPDIKALADYTYRQPLPVVTEAGWIAEHLRRHYGRSAVVVRNGIDKRLFCAEGEALAPRPEGGLRVLVEGPLGVAFKRVEYTIDLCRRAGIDDLWLLTSSDCSEYPGVRRVCSRVPMNDVPRVLRSCDVLVKLSTVEGMFGPPLEMMHCGGTAITTDVTGHDEYMGDGENGFVVRRGAEADVVKRLRALRSDRALLERLKAGGQRTAEAWPDWPESVRGFARFVEGICAAELRFEDRQRFMLEQLGAALRLAGPLHNAAHADHSGRELLRMAAGKAKRKLRRVLEVYRSRIAGAAGGDNRQPPLADARNVTSAAVAWPVDAAERAGGRPIATEAVDRAVAGSCYRLCFVGDARRYEAHVPAAAPRAVTTLLDVRSLPYAEVLHRAAAFGPDFTIVFDPETVPAAQLAQLPGRVIGYSPSPPNDECLAAWRLRFPAGGGGRALLHASSDAIPALRAAGIRAPGPFLLPVDVAKYERPVSDEDWREREIDVLLVGEASDDAALRAALEAFPGFVQVSASAGDRALAGILQRSKMAIHVARGPGDLLAAAKALRDALCGALLLACGLPDVYGFEPGEQYLHFGSPAELAALVRQQLALPDDRHVMRARAQAEARRHDAATEWVRIVENAE